jgi:hypothetical protein
MCVFKFCNSRVLEDARHVPSDLAVKSFLVVNLLTIQSASLRRKIIVYNSGIKLPGKVAAKNSSSSVSMQTQKVCMITARFLNVIK